MTLPNGKITQWSTKWKCLNGKRQTMSLYGKQAWNLGLPVETYRGGSAMVETIVTIRWWKM